tara:strand:- start:46 stop:690 length:645 start_codon:yes stop_codon:yes gene_type:complete
MKVLNLYAGLGGNRLKWPDYVEVTAVEMEPDIAAVYQAQFPNDNVIIGDAHQYLLDNHDKYDLVWSSTPCQTHSQMSKATRHDIRSYPDMSLWQEIFRLKHHHKGVWVVENVVSYYSKDLSVGFSPQIVDRHSFWCNFHIPEFKMEKPKNFIDSVSQQDLKDWLGIQYEGNIYYKGNHCPNQVLRNCCHPDLGLHVFESAKSINPTTIDQLSFL